MLAQNEARSAGGTLAHTAVAPSSVGGVAYILWPHEPAAQGIVILIAVLTLIAGAQLLRAISKRKGDLAALLDLSQTLGPLPVAESTKLVDSVSVDPVLRDAEALQQAGEHHPSGDEKSITLDFSALDANTRIGARVLALTDNPARAAVIDDEWSAKDQYELDRDIHLARFLGSILVFIGLIGTILGLGMAIGTIATGGEDIQLLQAQLSRALDGMGTGFSCTFWGVLGSVLVGAGVSYYQKFADAYLAGAGYFLRSHVVVELEAAVGARSGDAAASLELATNRMHDVLTPFATSLREGSVQIGAAAGELGKTVPSLQGFQLSLRDILEGFGKYLPDIAQAEADSRQQVIELSQQLSGVAQKLDENVPAIGAGASLVSQSISGLTSSFGQFNKQVEQRLIQDQESQAQLVAELKQAVRHLETALRDHPVAQEMATAVNYLGELSASLDNNVNAVNTETDRILGSIREMAKRFGEFSGDLRPVLKDEQELRRVQTEELRTTLGSMRALVGLVENSLQDAPVARTELSVLSSEGRATLENLQQATSALTKAATDLSQMSGSLNRQVGALEKLVYQLNQRPESFPLRLLQKLKGN